MKITIAALILALCVTGCATRGGWPCWAWEKNTDQKGRAIAQKMLDAQNQNQK